GPDPFSGLPSSASPCPFCPGAEAELERTLARLPETGPCRIRVVANRYPAVRGTAKPEALTEGATAATGRQEIVIESPEHDADFATYGREHAADVLRMLRDRFAVFEHDPAIAEVSVFRNKGRRAGASQAHPHSQIIGTAMLGPESTLRFDRARTHYETHGENLLEAVLRHELERAERLIREEHEFIAMTPFAPKEKAEAWIVPRSLRGSLSSLPDEALGPLASLLVDVVRRVLVVSGRSDYNLIFRTPPVAQREHPAAFWYIEVLPRGAGPAGYELTSGVPIVTVAPESAAAAMRLVASAIDGLDP
ncbi:MAG: DUF4931 domain-containing protein, partial [Polyangiaceae bacterium]|nr:DUF4931 domain-containing protein [Polyangiaceae bacterium]